MYQVPDSVAEREREFLQCPAYVFVDLGLGFNARLAKWEREKSDHQRAINAVHKAISLGVRDFAGRFTRREIRRASKLLNPVPLPYLSSLP